MKDLTAEIFDLMRTLVKRLRLIILIAHLSSSTFSADYDENENFRKKNRC
jgi:hypothetical protein